jgi:hypothetical protein
LSINYVFETLKKDKLLKGESSVAKIVAFLENCNLLIHVAIDGMAGKDRNAS